jgi:formyl-CoA transferase/CoA:oxalate CoA-transferase
MTQALEGITVLDLSHALAGPYCSTLLADFGANVVKIEPPDGEIARSWGVRLPGSNEKDYFTSLHRNKRGIVLDLKNDQAREVFLKMVEAADVVLENFRVGTMERLGIGYEVARKRNPRIIYCSISGYGQDGPYRDRPAMDLIVQAESGMISVTGESGRPGVRAGVSIADFGGGMNAALGVLLALHARGKTGLGQWVDVSMLESQVSLLSTTLAGFLTTGEIPEPMGTAYKPIVPYQTFRTATQDLALAVGTEKLWRAFCPAIGRPELSADPRFATNAARLLQRAELIGILEKVFLSRSYDEWEVLLGEAGIPVGRINNLEQLTNHPQVLARDAIVTVEHPRAGSIRMAGIPVRLSATPGAIRMAAPMLGEHNRDVLRDLAGVCDAEYERMQLSGVFGAAGTD